ncbi:hypothetical protein DFR49_3871 [Hephaestia caeni]|uniref:DDE superfamily endonuclease n=1 Tax=Hephaestia caeni TaxID=645617 RepID=A0A397NX55_9SPHN|nr:hypothetical protein [Hephaestia caeni]RIA37981.1 hypothetical protein DFR49_3871 [Hephaestia caeni]
MPLLFVAFNIAAGVVIDKCCKRDRATEFLDFLRQVGAAMPDGLDRHLVLDIYATDEAPRIKAWLARGMVTSLDLGVMD